MRSPPTGKGWEARLGSPPAALEKKGSSGRRAGRAQGQALTRPLSHPPQPPHTPDMEAARPVWPGCPEQQPKPRGSGLHFLPCPGGGTGGQTLHPAKNKEREGMTDRPVPRPSAACLTGLRRSPWLGQREQGLAPSGVPERSGDPCGRAGC